MWLVQRFHMIHDSWIIYDYDAYIYMMRVYIDVLYLGNI